MAKKESGQYVQASKDFEKLVLDSAKKLESTQLTPTPKGLPSWVRIPDFVLAYALGTVVAYIKNWGGAASEATKATVRKGMLLTYRAIRDAYAGDPDFEC